MTAAQRKYLYVQSPIGSAIVNALINGALGFAITKGLTEFPVWKAPGAAFDLVATAFGVAFGTCLGAALQIRLDLAKGRITPPAPSSGPSSWAARSPRGLFARALVVGVAATALFSPPVLAALAASSLPSLGRASFVELKAGFSAVEGALVTPFILLATLAHAPGQSRPTS